MTSRLRPTITMAVLIVTLLATIAAPVVEARGPRATRYRAGGPITLDTNLLSKSGASAWAIDAYLEARTPLPALGAAFMAAERKYGVNARFLLAAALHESGWGTSAIARNKHNLFGYNAYDRDPYRYATAFATYAANIDATARFMRESYLVPSGRWWGGAPTLRGMQKCWSSSGRWGRGVSRIATSIHLDSIRHRSITFASPEVSGTLHGGSQARVRVTWKGGTLPKGIEFVATWLPVELDSEIVAAAAADLQADAAIPDPAQASTLSGAADLAATASLSTPDPAHVARVTHTAVSVDAKRGRAAAHSIMLTVAAPDKPGAYRLDIELRDIGRRQLPAADRADVPATDVRVWGDRAVDYDLSPGPDGTGAIVRVTNTGREAIPAAPPLTALQPGDPEAQVERSVLIVSASTDGPGSEAPVQLVAAPLRADLHPGASVSFSVPGLDAATTGAASWLSVNLSVLGDPAWLAATSTYGEWLAAPVVATTPTPSPVAPAATPRATATPAPVTSPSPRPTPTAAPLATPRATLAPVATPRPRPAPVATPRPTRAPARTTKTYSERAGTIRYRGGWASAPNSGYLGGSVAWSKTVGATAAFTFTGSSIAWVGPKGPTRGAALVLLDGKPVARVSLWRSTFVTRTVLFKRTFRTTGRHTLTIRVLSVPSHPTVAIDGFIVRS
jgi:hypothetical protein